jgi:hypothetical protein
MKKIKKQKTMSAVLMALCLSFMGVFSRCEKKPEGEIYPKDIPFTEYSLENTSCGWVNLNYNDSVIIINSNEDLENYIDCADGGYPEIDFEEKTLLLVKGGATNGIVSITKHFIQTAASAYSFNIDIVLNDATVVEAILVPKIAETAVVELNVTFNQDTVTVCGVENPLIDLPWLKEYCDTIKETQNISEVSIDLYKVIDTDEHFFKIGIYLSEGDIPHSYTVDWKNCMGEFIIALYSGVPPSPEVIERYNEFLKDKEFVAKLFHYAKQ